jgi:hypothetical protein
LSLVLLHRVDGGEVFVNPKLVTSLHAAAGPRNKLVTGEAGCIIWMSDGKFLSVLERCEAVRGLLGQAPPR